MRNESVEVSLRRTNLRDQGDIIITKSFEISIIFLFQIGPWIYRRDELRLQLDSQNFTMQTEQSTSEWSVKDVRLNITQDSDTNTDSVSLKFTLLKR